MSTVRKREHKEHVLTNTLLVLVPSYFLRVTTLSFGPVDELDRQFFNRKRNVSIFLIFP